MQPIMRISFRHVCSITDTVGFSCMRFMVCYDMVNHEKEYEYIILIENKKYESSFFVVQSNDHTPLIFREMYVSTHCFLLCPEWGWLWWYNSIVRGCREAIVYKQVPITVPSLFIFRTKKVVSIYLLDSNEHIVGPITSFCIQQSSIVFSGSIHTAALSIDLVIDERSSNCHKIRAVPILFSFSVQFLVENSANLSLLVLKNRLSTALLRRQLFSTTSNKQWTSCALKQIYGAVPTALVRNN